MYHSHPPPSPPRRRRPRGPWIIAGAALFVVLGVTTYVLLQRLSDQVLTVIATVGCAAGLSLPTLLVALSVLLRQAESNGRAANHQEPMQMTRPVVTVIPPMALSQQPQAWPMPQQAPIPRTFTVVGEE